MSTRDEYVQKMHELLHKLDAEIDTLAARTGQVEADVRDEYHKQLAQLRTRRDEARAKLDALRDAGDGAWQDLKAGVELAWEALGEAVNSARSRLKK
ncbi:MAG: hypothetical protein ACLGG4_04445 [Gammaproteobacteria bacterium]